MPRKPSHNFGAFDARSSNSAFIASKMESALSARHTAARAGVRAAIEAPIFDPQPIAALASRDFYGIAVAVLMREAKIDDAVFDALMRPVVARVAAFRAARTFGAIRPDAEPTPVTLETLRALLPLENAACALAALGHCDFKTEKRTRPRAVFVLREVIAASRRS